MRKLLSFMVTIAIIATIALLPAEGYSIPRWRLYDDFNYGGIDPDPDRWDVFEYGPPGIDGISIANGRAKFDHYPLVNPEDINMLTIKMDPEQLRKIKGIRVTVTVEQCEGYPLTGIGAYIGKVEEYVEESLEEYYVWGNIYIFPGSKDISCSLALFDLPPPPVLKGNLFSGGFGSDIDIIGNTFTITILFSRNFMTYKVGGFGTIIRMLPDRLDPTDIYSRSLLTLGIGRAIVYFDDVYILK